MLFGISKIGRQPIVSDFFSHLYPPLGHSIQSKVRYGIGEDMARLRDSGVQTILPVYETTAAAEASFKLMEQF